MRLKNLEVSKYYLCTNCITIHNNLKEGLLVCSQCSYIETVDDYKIKLREAWEAVRFGYQYRSKYEEDYQKNQKLNGRYLLHELHEFFNFMGVAVLSGLIGNYAYDKIRALINRISNDSIVIELKDKKLKSFLQDELEQLKFIRYIEEFRNKNIKCDSKVIDAINDEIRAHNYSENFLSSPAGKKILARLEKLEKKDKVKKKRKRKK